jgi:hypothetical protein
MGRARDEAGNIWETDAQGNPVRLVQQGQAQMPADPTFPYQGAQAQAQAANVGADAAVNQATIGSQITSAAADATTKTRQSQTAGLPEGFMWGPDGQTAVPIPGYTRQGLSPEVRSNAIQAYTDAAALERAAAEIERRYLEGPATTSGLASVQDYLPTDANKVFNDAGQQARGYVKRALGFTGGEGNTVAESSALYDPYLPTAGDRDAQIEAKIAKLRQLANDSRQKAITTLGGVPDGNGNIVPNAMTENRFAQGGGQMAAGAGATEGAGSIPPEMQAEYEARLGSVMQNGRFDPAAYAALRSELDRKYGFPDTSSKSYLEWATDANKKLERGGATIGTTIPAPNVPLSGVDQFRNNLVSNPVGAGFAGALDMGGFGGVSALAPEQMAALSESQPLPMLAGQVAGSIGGTSALAKLGRETAGRFAPNLLGGGGRAQFARNLATDIGYAGAYGGISEGDPLTGAALGAVGSAGGQAVGRGLGAAVGGVAQAPGVRELAQLNIPMTVGQRLGGFAKGVEDKAISWPLVGDMIRARRAQGLEAFNRQAFNEAGSPIGARVQDIGEEGIQALTDQVGDAYTNATQGTNVPFDQQFQTDFAGAVAQGQRLPPDLRRSLGEVLDARVAPITDTGAMTGDQFQQAIRALKATRNRPPSRFEGFEDDYRGAVTGAMDALEGQMMRGGGQDVVTGLGAANAANRNMRTIEDAARRAAGGSESGTPFVFTPNQLQRAGLATEKRYPGPRPFADLADAGQQVLPSRIPNSGTADRLMQAGMGTALLGGAGVGYATDTQSAMAPAALTLALALGGTKTGQKALNAALFGRPAKAEMLGRAIKRRSGLFGSASLPLLISDY